MSEVFYYLKAKIPLNLEDGLAVTSYQDFGCSGIEEFAIEEAKVDEILGERSYSGGDIPTSVINDVESTLANENLHKKYYFGTEAECITFKNYLENNLELQSEVVSSKVKDWNAEWKKSYKPIHISEKLEIIPEWEKESYQSKAEQSLFIYPGMGFGTGNHETTYLCLKIYIEQLAQSKKFKTCFDFGCGSGILGIAFNLLEPDSKIDLYDISEEALVNSQQNIDLNQLDFNRFRLLLDTQKEELLENYDLVFANILQNVLLAESEFIEKSVKSGGGLILSGLLKGQESAVIDKLLLINPKFEHIMTESKGDWVAVLMEKK